MAAAAFDVDPVVGAEVSYPRLGKERARRSSGRWSIQKAYRDKESLQFFLEHRYPQNKCRDDDRECQHANRQCQNANRRREAGAPRLPTSVSTEPSVDFTERYMRPAERH